MIFHQATDAQIRAARILGGATMVAFLAARILGRQALRFRITVSVLYLVGVLGFVAYVMF
jgi:hypothetical protein